MLKLIEVEENSGLRYLCEGAIMFDIEFVWVIVISLIIYLLIVATVLLIWGAGLWQRIFFVLAGIPSGTLGPFIYRHFIDRHSSP
ncbi:hypothetical protein LCGC14_0338210 [marine sediment metagenome]|uniref:Uncharacterized protein n=1 Tax=marine sediment metagenome TaxID=412755 RepID=A0A0F9TXD1_9ZZZZ